MPGALKAKGIWKQNVCDGIGEAIPEKENEYLNANTHKGLLPRMPFQINVEKGIFKTIGFLHWMA